MSDSLLHKPNIAETIASDESINSTDIGGKTYARIKDTDIAFLPIGDRIIIEEDIFRTGYECKTCDGFALVPCKHCSDGTEPDMPYRQCAACGGTREVLCPTCGGKGALIVVPELSERRPTSGVIRAIGSRVTEFKVGDHVMYGNHSGHVQEFRKKRAVMRIMRESEVMCIVAGVMVAS